MFDLLVLYIISSSFSYIDLNDAVKTFGIL